MRAHQTTYSSIWNFLPGSVQDSALHRWTAHVLRGLNCLLTFLACTINTGGCRRRTTTCKKHPGRSKYQSCERRTPGTCCCMAYTCTAVYEHMHGESTTARASTSPVPVPQARLGCFIPMGYDRPREPIQEFHYVLHPFSSILHPHSPHWWWWWWWWCCGCSS